MQYPPGPPPPPAGAPPAPPAPGAPASPYGPPPAPAAQALGRLDVNLSFNPLQFILALVKPKLFINGQLAREGWTRHLVDLPPGRYRIDTFFPYLFQDRCGPAFAEIEIHAGHATGLSYESPFFMFSNGTFRPLGHYALQPQGAPQGPPPGQPAYGQGQQPPGGYGQGQPQGGYGQGQPPGGFGQGQPPGGYGPR